MTEIIADLVKKRRSIELLLGHFVDKMNWNFTEPSDPYSHIGNERLAARRVRRIRY